MDENTIIADAILANVEGKLIEGTDVPVTLVPKSAGIVNLERFMNAPNRLTVVRQMHTTQSLIDYIKAFKSDASSLYVNMDRRSMVYVVDHSNGKIHNGNILARWESHRARYEMHKTREWSQWRKHDRVSLSQRDFAEFIEDRIEDIANPNSAALLQMVDNFKIVQSLDFKSSMRRNTGEVELAYKTENKTGSVEMPEEIVLGISPFQRGPKYEVRARITFSHREGQLSFKYKIVDPDVVEDDAFDAEVETVKDSAFDLHVYYGTTD